MYNTIHIIRIASKFLPNTISVSFSLMKLSVIICTYGQKYCIYTNVTRKALKTYNNNKKICSFNYNRNTFKLMLYLVLPQSAVNHIQWSPFNPDVFLSCSSDWSIQLWKQGHYTPVLSFTSVQRAVYSAKWSPNWPTVFAAINGQQLEIWDLNLNMWVRLAKYNSLTGLAVMSEFLFF